MPAGLAARWNGDDRGGNHEFTVGIGEWLTEDRLVVGQEGRQQVLVFGGCRCRFLSQGCRSGESEGEGGRRADGTQTEHYATPTGKRGGPDSRASIGDHGKQTFDA